MAGLQPFSRNLEELKMKKLSTVLAASALAVVAAQASAASWTVTGSGSLVGQTSTLPNSTYAYTGAGTDDGTTLSISVAQAITNSLGLSTITSDISFNMTTGTGTSEVTACTGSPYVCTAGIVGTTAVYQTQNQVGTGAPSIAWDQILVIDTGFVGLADSSSSFVATASAVPVPAAAWLFGSALIGLAGVGRKRG